MGKVGASKRILTALFGIARHGNLPSPTGGSATGLSATGACATLPVMDINISLPGPLRESKRTSTAFPQSY